jgi:hypothetical protein
MQWKGKRKRGHFFKTPISNVNICVTKKLGIEGEFSNTQKKLSCWNKCSVIRSDIETV